MVKMFYARRNPDSSQKKQIKESSTLVAQIMLKHLSLKNFGKQLSSSGQIHNFDYIQTIKLLSTITIA